MKGYPDCENPTKCRFSEGPVSRTCMFSPITFNRDGEATGGGNNILKRTMVCYTCGKQWSSSMTELESARGCTPQWTEEPK